MSTRGRQSPREGRGSEGEGELWRALEEGLAEVLPGLEVLDRDLVFDEGGRADLAGVEPSGRLVLVLLAEDLDRTPLEVLDALSFARRHGPLFARHLAGAAPHVPAIAAELPAKLVVVTPTMDERLTLRLAPLLGSGVELYGVRTLASRAGERSYLVPLSAPEGSQDAGPRDLDSFLATLAPERQPLARELAERLERLDDQLEPSFGRAGCTWRLHGEVLVRLEREGRALRASAGPRGGSLVLAERADLERVLERALARLVVLLARPEGGAPPQAQAGDPAPGGGPRILGGPPRGPATGPTGPRPLTPEPPAAGPPTPRALLESNEPLLTAEELQAFRE